MAEARLWLGEKTVMELDPVTGGWFLVTKGSGGTSTVAFPTGTSQIITESWKVDLKYDETVTGSSKTFTVPANQEWEILWVWAEFTSLTGTVGNRQIGLMIMDNAADTIGRYQAGMVQGNGLVKYYLFAPSLADMTAFRDTDFLTTPLPPTLILSAGQIIKIWDNKSIDAGGDTLIIQMQIAWRNVI